MSTGYALLVGLKQVDPGTHNGWDGTGGCTGCEIDVDNMKDILHPLNYKIETLKTAQATHDNVLNALKQAKQKLKSGDIFVFYYSGHGGQQPDASGDELDGKDETLVTYDKDIVDDELDQVWVNMPAGVRIVMLSDSCNSGTNYRNKKDFAAPTPFIPITNLATIKNMKAELIHYGGCRDGFSSYGFDPGGAFTIALCEAWNNGNFQGNYKQFYDTICQKIKNTPQKPQYNEYGPVSELFRIQRPFTIQNPNLKLAQASWIHGHSMQVEYPDRLTLVDRKGYYMRVRGKPFTKNWFHFAIPTPVIVNGRRLCVGSVMVRFRVGPGASVHAAHIYDGEKKIASHNGLNLAPQGHWSTPRFDVPTKPDIKWGLGLSLGVAFGDDANLPSNKLLVEISAAGCDFMQEA